MGRKKLPTPERYCEYCGEQLVRRSLASGYEEGLSFFNERRFCNTQCSQKHRSLQPIHGDSRSTGSKIARSIVPPGACVDCGIPDAPDVHHKDKNNQNNSPENLVRLCKKCHYKYHRSWNLCIVCGLPAKGLNLCSKHYQSYKKHLSHGKELPEMLRLALEAQVSNGGIAQTQEA